MKTTEYDLIAIGGGTAGLVTAAGAAYLGLKPALVERSDLGGDCLWTGCVPSKALVASARLAHAMRNAEALGLVGVSPSHAFEQVMGRMRKARERVAHHDDPERFRTMGVDVLFGDARFVDPRTVEVEGVGTIRSPRIVVATGARAAIPPVPGLEETGYLTHATAFERNELPSSVIILGGGPVGLEFAQVYRRLGARVTVVEMLPEILPREDPDVARTLRSILREEGVRFHLGSPAVRIGSETIPAGEGEGVRGGEDEPSAGRGPGEREDRASGAEVHGRGPKVVLLDDGTTIRGHEIFVATGREPVTEGLELARAGVEVRDGAVRVDDRLRTTARTVWAAGDVTGGLQFTHVADYMARTVVRNAVFPLGTKVDYSCVPRVTYTDPEAAHVGLGQEEAEERGARTFTAPFHDLDRAIVDGRTGGYVKVSADGKGRILGATILGAGAGELVMPLVLAKQNDLSLSRVSDAVFPYPTMVEGVRKVADDFQRSRLEGRGGQILKKLVSWLT